jgi:hypothetical protein
MGGYIVVIDKNDALSMYGLTAGHAIVHDVFEEEIQSEKTSEAPNTERVLFPTLATTVSPQVSDSDRSRNMHTTSYNLTTKSQEVIEWSGIAKVVPESFSNEACDRDWALFEATPDQASSGIQQDQLFESYDLGEPRKGTLWIDDEVEMSLQPPFIGKLSRLPSFAILSYGNDLVRVHTITMRNARGK